MENRKFSMKWEVHEHENLQSGQESFDEEVMLTEVKDKKLPKGKEWKNRGNWMYKVPKEGGNVERMKY